MNFNYIDIDEASINKRLEKCKELIIDSRYKNMYIKMEYISRYIENELEDDLDIETDIEDEDNLDTGDEEDDSGEYVDDEDDEEDLSVDSEMDEGFTF